MSRVDVSVIMPCFNGAGHVARSVSSALCQSYSDIELLFIDDGSTDESSTVASKFEDMRMQMHSQANAGVSAARNRGLALARGKYIAFLDADDTWDPAFLEKMVAALEPRPEAALAYCGWQNVGLSGGRAAPFVPPDYEVAEKRAQLVERCRWPIHAAVTRAAAIKTVGGFNKRFTVGEDFLLWMEIGCFNPIVRVPEVLAYYHHHEGAQATDNKIRAALQPYEAQRTFLSRHPDVASQFGAARTRDLTLAPLLAKGYSSYWTGDLDSARAIFRQVMKRGYGGVRDWKYMLPALLPRTIHRAALGLVNDAQHANGTR